MSVKAGFVAHLQRTDLFVCVMCSKPPVWKMLSKLTGIKVDALIEDLVPPGNPETITVPCQRLGIWLVSKRIGLKWQRIQQRSILAITLFSIFQALLVRG